MRTVTTWIIWLSILGFVQTPGAFADVSQVIRSLGFSELNSAPAQFELPDIKGKNVALKEFKGKWTWLVFWATWCGPCAYEMPKLESLYQEFKDQGLNVVGVSVDLGNLDAVKAFISSEHISFPNLWDGQGTVAEQYQASSIPTLYLISPDYKLAGIFRGAKDWQSPAVFQSVKQLLKYKELGGASSSADQTAVSLPEDLLPPEMDFEPLNQAVSLGKPVDLNLVIGWKGTPEKYFIRVPELTVPEGISIEGVSSRSQSGETEAKLIYTFTMKAHKAGGFHLGPLEMVFRPRQGGTEQHVRLAGLDIQVASPASRQWWWLALCLGLIVFGAIGWLVSKKRKPKTIEGPATPDWVLQYKDMRSKKAELSSQQYAVKLLELCLLAIDNDQTVIQLLQRVRYGGASVPSEKILYYEKQLDRLVEQRGETK